MDIEACIASPERCNPVQITPIQGTARAILTNNIQKLVSSGQRARTNTPDPTSLTVTKIEVESDGGRAVVLACLWDTTILYVPRGNVDGSDKIIDDSKASFDERFTMVLEDGQWLTELAEDIAKHPDENTCRPG